MKHALIASVVLFLLAAPAVAAEIPDWVTRTKISGLVFGDAYTVVSNHDTSIEGENGFWFRRIYLTFDSKLDENLSWRLRFESNSAGDFTTSTTVDPFVKDAYVKWKRDKADFYFGLSSSPTWGLVEKSWGYRPVEKSPLDLMKLGSSRDFGVAIKGRFDADGKVRYHAMLGNGASTKGETNEGKKAMLAVSFHPTDDIQVEVYGDFDNRPGETNRQNFQVFSSYQGDKFRVGALLARQERETGPGTKLNLDIASVYGVVKLREKLTLLGRVDRMFDPNPDGAKIAYIPFDPTSRSMFALLGLDFAVAERFSVIPNVEAVFYDAVGAGPEPDNDLIARITVFAKF